MAWLRRWLELSSRGWVLIGLAALNALVIWRFGVRSQLYAPPDAIAAQLAFWPSVFAGIVEQWGPQRAHAFLATLWRLDFVFPLLYASFLRGLYVWLGRTLGGGTRRGVEWAPWIAAGLDFVENLLQVRLVGLALAGETAGSGFAAGVLVMSGCAALKATLLVASVLGLLAILLRSQVAWAVWTCRFALLSLLLGSLPLVATSQGLDLLRVVADDALTRAQAGVTYAALLLWAVSAWYWSRVVLQVRWRAGEPGGAGEREDAGRSMATWLPRALGTATLLLAALAFARASAGMPEPLRGRLVLHAGCCLGLALVFFYLVALRRRLLRLSPEPGRFESPRALPRTTRAIAAASLAVSGVSFLLFVLAPVVAGSLLGAPAIVFLAAANAVFFGSATVLLSRALRIPVASFALLAAAVFSGWNDNHAVRLVDGAPQPRPQLRAAFEVWAAPRLAAWREAEMPGRLPVFLVAAEGGGIRAAYWTAVVLGRLRDRHPGFERHVFGISGVSGGSLGAAVFVALLHDGVPEPACRAHAEGRRHLVEGVGPAELCAQEVLRQDLLAPVVGTLVAPDFLQWFLPVPVPAFDRSRALEDSWSAAYERVTGQATLVSSSARSTSWSVAAPEFSK